MRNWYTAKTWFEALDWALSLSEPESFIKPASRPRIVKEGRYWMVCWHEIPRSASVGA